ncbi:hypothetical protein IQ272_23105 [Chroococcidiopsidales cyanobacterium LEGE 13417]|nr:hypothetical protein [Chroococcidiopsidales cyanobacterium LEGE 13417]
MKRPIWAAATVSALCFSLVTSHNPLLAASVRTIPMREARGEAGRIPTLTIWEETGLNINFIPTGEVVKKVWLDDPSRLGVDFDGTLCLEAENCSDAGATVIHLRRINPIKFPQLPKTQATLLSVVTQGEDGAKNLYQFHIAYGQGKPQYVSVNIAPATNFPLSQQLQKPSTAQAVVTHTQFQGKPVVSPATIPVNPARTANNPAVTSRDRQPTPTTSIEEQIELIEAGLANANQKNLIGEQRQNLYLMQRLQQFITFLRQGNSTEDAARRARIPIHFVNTLKQLGSTSTK